MNTYYSLKTGEYILPYSWANAPGFRICSTSPWNGREADMSSLLNEEPGRVACFATENVRRHRLAYLQGQSLNMLASFFFVAARASDLLLEKSWPGVATAPTPQMKILRPGLNTYSLEHSCYSQLHWPGKKGANGRCWKPQRRAGRVTTEKNPAMNLTGAAKNPSTKNIYRNNINNFKLTFMLDMHVFRLLLKCFIAVYLLCFIRDLIMMLFMYIYISLIYTSWYFL